MSIDPNDYTIIKEGAAEILMLAGNEVFYNKTQVNNRDLSIAVLRTFISKRKEEHEALLSKKKKNAEKGKVPVKDDLEPIVGEEPSSAVEVNGESNGGSEVLENLSEEGPCSTSIEPLKATQGKGRELKPVRVLEALSASGLRAIRYAREIEEIGHVVAVDNDPASVEACKRNIKFNGSVACEKVESHFADAPVYMLTHKNEFDMVDLDPYGSPSVFLDSAIQSMVDGGMLMCTATDMAVLCGGNGEVCYSKVMQIATSDTLFPCYQCKWIFTSASAMKNTPLKLSHVYQCIGCDSFHFQPIGRTVSKNNSVRHLPGFGPAVSQECSDCGKKYNMGGPIWSAPIHDQEWVTSILTDVKSMKHHYPAFNRISTVLTAISEELPDVPLFFSLHSLCATLKCTPPSAVIFRSAVINAGYHISSTHVNPLGLKSDAPWDVIWDIMRCWVKSHPVKGQAADLAGSIILAKEPVLQASFARAVASLSKAQAKKVARFLPNPESHWGPKLRAGRTITSKHESLIGANAVNAVLNQRLETEGEEPNAKRQKSDGLNPVS